MSEKSAAAPPTPMTVRLAAITPGVMIRLQADTQL